MAHQGPPPKLPFCPQRFMTQNQGVHGQTPPPPPPPYSSNGPPVPQPMATSVHHAAWQPGGNSYHQPADQIHHERPSNPGPKFPRTPVDYQNSKVVHPGSRNEGHGSIFRQIHAPPPHTNFRPPTSRQKPPTSDKSSSNNSNLPPPLPSNLFPYHEHFQQPPNFNCSPFGDFLGPVNPPVSNITPPFTNPLPGKVMSELWNQQNQGVPPQISNNTQWTTVEQQHTSAGEISPSPQSRQSIHEKQREEDLAWIKNFTTKISRTNTQERNKRLGADFKIHEAQTYLKEAFTLRAELRNLLLQVQSDPMAVIMNIEPKFRKLKARLAEIEKVFADEQNRSSLQRRIGKVTKKRARLQRLREREIKEMKETKKKRQKISDEIDHWIQGLAQKERDVKRAQELKQEADHILGEVRRKQLEAKRGLDLLKALTKLRQVRKDKAQSRGVFINPETDRTYNERLEALRDMWLRQLQTYEEEQRVLEVMMEVEQKETTERENQKTRQKDERKLREYKSNLHNWLFGKSGVPSENDPLYVFRQYYESANHSLDNLIRVRQEWDMFVSEQGSALPQGWVTPLAPASEVWATALLAQCKQDS